MPCNPEVLKHVPLYACLDDEETAVLAGQVALKTFVPRQRIYKMRDSAGRAYVTVAGRVRVSTVDEDHQEVVVDEPRGGEFFGFASMLEQTPHQTEAVATEETVCIEVDRNDILVLLQRKPHAGMEQAHQAVCKAGVEIDLDQDRHGNQQNMKVAAGDVVRFSLQSPPKAFPRTLFWC